MFIYYILYILYIMYIIYYMYIICFIYIYIIYEANFYKHIYLREQVKVLIILT